MYVGNRILSCPNQFTRSGQAPRTIHKNIKCEVRKRAIKYNTHVKYSDQLIIDWPSIISTIKKVYIFLECCFA